MKTHRKTKTLTQADRPNSIPTQIAWPNIELQSVSVVGPRRLQKESRLKKLAKCVPVLEETVLHANSVCALQKNDRTSYQRTLSYNSLIIAFAKAGYADQGLRRCRLYEIITGFYNHNTIVSNLPKKLSVLESVLTTLGAKRALNTSGPCFCKRSNVRNDSARAKQVVRLKEQYAPCARVKSTCRHTQSDHTLYQSCRRKGFESQKGTTTAASVYHRRNANNRWHFFADWCNHVLTTFHPDMPSWLSDTSRWPTKHATAPLINQRRVILRLNSEMLSSNTSVRRTRPILLGPTTHGA